MTKQISIDAIGSGKAAIDAKVSDDKIDRQEEQAAKIEKLKNEAAAVGEQNEDRKSDRELRKEYAQKVFRYLVGYSFGCATILVLAGWSICGFRLPDLVLSILVGSTAVSAIGLVGFVVSGLFKGR